MTAAIATPPVSNAARRTGQVMSALVVLFLLMDGAIKVVPLDIVIETMRQLDIPVGLTRTLGVLTLGCTILYAIPQTSVLGAILLTGYLGGAIYVHVRAGSPLFTHTLFSVYLSLLIWGGLYLRDAAVRALIPLRRQATG